MKSVGMTVLGGALVLGAGASALQAQSLEEVCPNSEDGTGVLYGLVSDEAGEMGLPGANVVVTWEKDGESGRAEGGTAFDGGYTICYIPMRVELAVQPIFANLGGASVTLNLSEEITRQDLGFPLAATGGGDDGAERIWACVGGSDDNQINLQNARLIRCDPNWQGLERCPKEQELGRVQATMTGAGVGMVREAIERMVADAKRLGANALISWNLRDLVTSESVDIPRAESEQPRRRDRSIEAEAVVISVDPSTCT